MQIIESMISTRPNGLKRDSKRIAECVATCAECELACLACADACLVEHDLGMLRRCMRVTMDCAEVCGITARLLARPFSSDSELEWALLEACARACAVCGAACYHQAEKHEHCKLCGDACRRCEEICRELLREPEGS